MPRPTPEQMRVFPEAALAEAAVGRLRPVVVQRFPLERGPTFTRPSKHGPPWARPCWRFVMSSEKVGTAPPTETG